MSGYEPLVEQEIWRERLNEAERQYRKAAGKARDAARLEYLRVLRIFTDLVIRGKPPAASEDHS